jgi:cell cycle arrest protein BUB3
MSQTEEIKLANAPTDGISSLNFSTLHITHLLVTSWDKTVRLYDTYRNSQLFQYTHEASVLDGCFSPNSTHIFSGGLDQTLYSFDITAQKQTMIGKHDNAIKSVCAIPGNVNLVVTGGWDCKMKLWDVRTTEAIAQVDLEKKVYTLDITRDGSKLVVGTNDRQVLVYEISNAKFKLHQRRESSLKYQTRCIRNNIDSTGYALSSIEGRVAIEYFDPSQQVQQQKYAFKCHRGKESGPNGTIDVLYPVNAIAYHPKYGTFATGGSDGYVNVWDGNSKKRLCQYHKYPTGISALAFNSEGTNLAIASSYSYDEGEKTDVAPDEIYVRKVLDIDVRPKHLTK